MKERIDESGDSQQQGGDENGGRAAAASVDSLLKCIKNKQWNEALSFITPKSVEIKDDIGHFPIENAIVQMAPKDVIIALLLASNSPPPLILAIVNCSWDIAMSLITHEGWLSVFIHHHHVDVLYTLLLYMFFSLLWYYLIDRLIVSTIIRCFCDIL